METETETEAEAETSRGTGTGTKTETETKTETGADVTTQVSQVISAQEEGFVKGSQLSVPADLRISSLQEHLDRGLKVPRCRGGGPGPSVRCSPSRTARSLDFRDELRTVVYDALHREVTLPHASHGLVHKHDDITIQRLLEEHFADLGGTAHLQQLRSNLHECTAALDDGFGCRRRQDQVHTARTENLPH